jgi:hypothetical protein
MPNKSMIKLGEPLPGFLFKPGEWIINSHRAEELRKGRCTRKQFEVMTMLVVGVGISDKSKIERYRLLSQLRGVVDHPSKKIVEWHLRIYVESNFELCDHPRLELLPRRDESGLVRLSRFAAKTWQLSRQSK